MIPAMKALHKKRFLTGVVDVVMRFNKERREREERKERKERGGEEEEGERGAKRQDDDDEGGFGSGRPQLSMRRENEEKLRMWLDNHGLVDYLMPLQIEVGVETLEDLTLVEDDDLDLVASMKEVHKRRLLDGIKHIMGTEDGRI